MAIAGDSVAGTRVLNELPANSTLWHAPYTTAGWKFCEALAAAANRGVKVQLVLDEFGAKSFEFGGESEDHPSTVQWPAHLLLPLSHPPAHQLPCALQIALDTP